LRGHRLRKSNRIWFKVLETSRNLVVLFTLMVAIKKGYVFVFVTDDPEIQPCEFAHSVRLGYNVIGIGHVFLLKIWR